MLFSLLGAVAPVFTAAVPQAPLPTSASVSTLHFADIDGDGLDDALVIGPGGGVTLLANRGEGRFEDVTRLSGLGQIEFASCALFADFDGDGRVDLFVGSSEKRLWRNLGRSTFEAVDLGVDHDLVDLEARALDHDSDGRLDLHLHTEAGDVFYRNAPSGRFERVELPGADHPALSSSSASADDDADDTSSATASESPARTRYRRWLRLRARNTTSSASNGANASNLMTTSGMTATSTGPLALAGFPTLICAGTIVDQANGQCIQASSIGVVGELYPLSSDFFVDSANSRVGVGTATPLYTLHVAGKLVSGVNTSASGTNAAVGGGASNVASGAHSTVAGGESNTAGTTHAFIGGGLSNTTTGTRAVIGGGISNKAGNSSVVGGGSNNEANFNFSTVAGGRLNIANGTYSTIGGGASNSATGQYAFIGGGGEDNLPASGNSASGLASAIGGGRANVASGDRASVGGGSSNQSTSQHTAIAGGRANSAFGAFGAIPGGELNVAAGSHSLAAGRRAKALHDGAFVWADSANADFSSTAPNQFLVRAAGGVGIDRTPDPAMKLDVNGAVRASDTIVSSKPSGAPFDVVSTDLNINLNADLLDGFHASAFSTFGALVDTAEIADNAVTSNKIANATITNADISSLAAIAGAKVAPNFGAQDLVTTGRVAIGTSTLGEQLTVAGVIESTSGGVKYPDGSVQATAQLVGPQGPAGPTGPQGPEGPPGPSGPTEPTDVIGTIQFFDQGVSQGSPVSLYDFEMRHGPDSVSATSNVPTLTITKELDANSHWFHDLMTSGPLGVDARIRLTALDRPWDPGAVVVIDTIDIHVQALEQHEYFLGGYMRDVVTLTAQQVHWTPTFGPSASHLQTAGSWSSLPFANQPLHYHVKKSLNSTPPVAGVDLALHAGFVRPYPFSQAEFEIGKPLSADTSAMLERALSLGLPPGLVSVGAVQFDFTNNGGTPQVTYSINSAQLKDWSITVVDGVVREQLRFVMSGSGQVTVGGVTTSL